MQPPTGAGAGSSPRFKWNFLRRSMIGPLSFHLNPESWTAMTTSERPVCDPPGDLDAHAGHAEELVRARVHERVGRAEVRAGVLPLLAVAAPGRAGHLVGERDAARRLARAVAAVGVGGVREKRLRDGRDDGQRSREREDGDREWSTALHWTRSSSGAQARPHRLVQFSRRQGGRQQTASGCAGHARESGSLVEDSIAPTCDFPRRQGGSRGAEAGGFWEGGRLRGDRRVSSRPIVTRDAAILAFPRLVC